MVFINSQGSILYVYTTPWYYPDIKTLKDLDASGLPISLSTGEWLMDDMFGSSPNSTTMKNLRNKALYYGKIFHDTFYKPEDKNFI